MGDLERFTVEAMLVELNEFVSTRVLIVAFIDVFQSVKVMHFVKRIRWP